jgi:DNA modification methylase/superfamily II DNA or RNA helicase
MMSLPAAYYEGNGMSEYAEFLESKRPRHNPFGFQSVGPLNPMGMDFQLDLVHWSLRLGRSSVWADCGLGKTFMQLEWARVVHEKTNRNVLILSPLAVSKQTEREAAKFGIEAHVCREASDIRRGINITNYERLERFSPDDFSALVCDESSILKSFEGSTRKQITDFAAALPYRLGCSATPAPNDFMEFGTQSEFVGSLSRQEMLAMFFIHDGGETSKWRLKKHAEDEFWKWISSWAAYIRKPSDLGYEDRDFILPALNIEHHVLESGAADGQLFAVEGQTLNERRAARKASMSKRVSLVSEMVNSSKDYWLVWCDFNAESEALTDSVPDAIEVTGSMDADEKAEKLDAFATGKIRCLVSKPSIAGWGLNLQHCHNMAFVGLSDSFEQYYQATRRCWRFGQKEPVNVHVVTSEAEGATVRNIQRKEADANRMAERIAEHMKDLMQTEVRQLRQGGTEAAGSETSGDGWTAIHGDCVASLKSVPADSLDYSVFSPPFSSLYTYSDALADMGNCLTHSEFYEHFRFCVVELFRVLRPGRLLSFHCMNLPTSKERDGVIGITDFRGNLIRLFQDAGFIYHSEVAIWKDPVTAMQRTKALGLLHKQLRKDSSMSRQGIADYLVTMRKPGANPEPVYHYRDYEEIAEKFKGNSVPAGEMERVFPVSLWQNYASPVWMDINPSDTLQKNSAREEEDERHICPLQLEVIRRAIRLWTNPGDTVLSPFMGIGSEGHVALEMGRKFIGIELKKSYFDVAVKNLEYAARQAGEQSLFNGLQEATSQGSIQESA